MINNVIKYHNVLALFNFHQFQARESAEAQEEGSEIKVQPFSGSADLAKFLSTEDACGVFLAFKKPLRCRAFDHLLTPIAPIASSDPDFGVTLDQRQQL